MSSATLTLRRAQTARPNADGHRGFHRRNWSGWLYVVPSLVIMMLIAFTPIVMSAYLSFTSYDVFTSLKWIGLDNYVVMLRDENFWSALRNTAIFTVIAVPLQVMIPMLLADFLANHTGRKFSQIARSVLFIPVVASMVLVGTVWQYMLSPDGGFFNWVIAKVGMEPQNFLGKPVSALVAVSLVTVWKNIGYFLVLFYAGVMDIPTEQYEAAKVDGAGGVKRFWHVTVPGLKPVVVLSTIWSFQVFDIVYSMTGGGPGGATTTIVMSVFQGIRSFDLGYSSAIAMALLVVVLVVAIVQRACFRED